MYDLHSSRKEIPVTKYLLNVLLLSLNTGFEDTGENIVRLAKVREMNGKDAIGSCAFFFTNCNDSDNTLGVR